MCVLSIKVPIRKSLETYLMIHIYYSWHQILAMFSLVNPHEIQAFRNGSPQNRCHH